MDILDNLSFEKEFVELGHNNYMRKHILIPWGHNAVYTKHTLMLPQRGSKWYFRVHDTNKNAIKRNRNFVWEERNLYKNKKTSSAIDLKPTKEK